jgi:hypothetical protein
MAASGTIDLVLASLHRFRGDPNVQVQGLKFFEMFMLTGGELGEVEAKSALAALQRNKRNTDVADMALAMLSTLLCGVSATPRASRSGWMLALLGTPDAVAVLKSSLDALERAGKCKPGHAHIVHWMTHGACAGCGKLQETKMKLCGRCRKARYCSDECLRSHWPVHKLSCERPT